MDTENQQGVEAKQGIVWLTKAAQVWHEDFEDKLKTLGYAPLESAPGVFLGKSAKESWPLMCMWMMRQGYV